MNNIIDNEKLEALLFSIGIIADFNDEERILEMDSLTFVSLIVELENLYERPMPENFYDVKLWHSIKKIKNSIGLWNS